MKKPLLASALAVGAVTAVGATVAYSAIVTVPSHGAQDRLTHRGAVVRVGPVVQLHTNSTHASVGVTKTQLVNGCYLRVFFDTAAGEKVVSVQVDEDESLSRLGISAGASGGNAYANVYLYRRDGRPVCANNKSLGTMANLWIEVLHIAPPKTAPSELKPAPTPAPTLESQQRSVPSIARATVTPEPAR